MYKQEGKTMLLLEQVSQLRIELPPIYMREILNEIPLKRIQEKSLLVLMRHLSGFYSSFADTDFVPYSPGMTG